MCNGRLPPPPLRGPVLQLVPSPFPALSKQRLRDDLKRLKNRPAPPPPQLCTLLIREVKPPSFLSNFSTSGNPESNWPARSSPSSRGPPLGGEWGLWGGGGDRDDLIFLQRKREGKGSILIGYRWSGYLHSSPHACLQRPLFFIMRAY